LKTLKEVKTTSKSTKVISSEHPRTAPVAAAAEADNDARDLFLGSDKGLHSMDDAARSNAPAQPRLI